MLYTFNDLYKKRKKFMWIFRIIKGYMLYMLISWYGDEHLIPYYVALSFGIKQKKSLKEKKQVGLKI